MQYVEVCYKISTTLTTPSKQTHFASLRPLYQRLTLMVAGAGSTIRRLDCGGYVALRIFTGWCTCEPRGNSV